VSALLARRSRVSTLACVLGLAAAGCGQTSHPPTSENNGVYIKAGPLTYQLQISRVLNQYATEDSQYVTGIPLGQGKLAPRQLWYGVFVWAKNQTDKPQTTTGNFDIVDTSGKHYYPIAVNPALNAYAWTPRALQPGGTEPAPDTTASFGPTQGSLLLFKLDNSIFSNRPLVLEIRGPQQQRWGAISLDL
jgi:hypothetical protein